MQLIALFIVHNRFPRELLSTKMKKNKNKRKTKISRNIEAEAC